MLLAPRSDSRTAPALVSDSSNHPQLLTVRSDRTNRTVHSEHTLVSDSSKEPRLSLLDRIVEQHQPLCQIAATTLSSSLLGQIGRTGQYTQNTPLCRIAASSLAARSQRPPKLKRMRSNTPPKPIPTAIRQTSETYPKPKSMVSLLSNT